MRVRFVVPGSAEPLTVELQPGDAVLVGREPDRTRLPPESPVPPDRIAELVVVAPSVSANHALIAVSGDKVDVFDLESRNGSWLRLPQRRAVTFNPDVNEVDLGLALVFDANADDPPDDASWSGRDDFANAVAVRVERWLSDRAIRATVSVARAGTRRSEDQPHPPWQIPLPERMLLNVAPVETMDANWTVRLSQVWQYVARQTAIFDSEKATREEGVILASDSIREAHREVVEASVRGLRMLLVGPSGSGKEGLARVYHRHGRSSGPLITINCAKLSKEFLQTELFGAEEGAFTGSVRRIIGAVERAHGGTLFLDEIGELPLEVQPMLLRFLDHGEYDRLGAYGQSRRADVRLVCATNKDLATAVARGEFREDLWYRISIQVVRVPSLRERREDIIAYLQTTFIGGQLTAWQALSPPAQIAILNHSWPGNFRELQSVVLRLGGDCSEESISEEQVRRAIDKGTTAVPIGTPSQQHFPAATASLNDWLSFVADAVAAYTVDYQGVSPVNWNEIKIFIEKYLKPVLFAHLSGGAAQATMEEALDTASRLGADRGTFAKQLARFFERFRGQAID
jgi:DNA-binding NtrC family response regulator